MQKTKVRKVTERDTSEKSGNSGPKTKVELLNKWNYNDSKKITIWISGNGVSRDAWWGKSLTYREERTDHERKG